MNHRQFLYGVTVMGSPEKRPESSLVPGFTTMSSCEITKDIFVNSLEEKRWTVARCVEVR